MALLTMMPVSMMMPSRDMMLTLMRVTSRGGKTPTAGSGTVMSRTILCSSLTQRASLNRRTQGGPDHRGVQPKAGRALTVERHLDLSFAGGQRVVHIDRARHLPDNAFHPGGQGVPPPLT